MATERKPQLIPVLATPFDERGAIDLSSLRRLAEFQLAAGADGVALFGFASEGFALAREEKLRILAAVREVMDGQGSIVIGISATSAWDASEQVLELAGAPVAAAMVVPPFMVKPSPAQIVDFYATVAAVGVPVMVQDAPGTTGVSMPVGLIADVARSPGVASVKVEAPPTAPKIGALRQAVAQDVDLFGGQNALFCLEELDRGAVGTMPACEFTDLLVPVLRSWHAGEQAKAREEFKRLLPLIRFGLQPGIAWAVHKHVLRRRGLIAHDAVRAPAAPADRATLRHLDVILDDLPLAM